MAEQHLTKTKKATMKTLQSHEARGKAVAEAYHGRMAGCVDKIQARQKRERAAARTRAGRDGRVFRRLVGEARGLIVDKRLVREQAVTGLDKAWGERQAAFERATRRLRAREGSGSDDDDSAM